MSEPATRDQEIARTILAQLGGNRFKVMTGASSFSSGDSSLSFRLPSRLTRHNAAGMVIKLECNDTYTVKLLKYNAKVGNVDTVDQRSDVYAGDLRALFAEMTGLATSL